MSSDLGGAHRAVRRHRAQLLRVRRHAALAQPRLHGGALRVPVPSAGGRQRAVQAQALGHALQQAPVGRERGLRPVADPGRHDGGAAAPLPVRARLRQLAAVQVQHRDLALGGLDVSDRHDDAADRPGVVHAVALGERAAAARDPVERAVEERLPVLIQPLEAGRAQRVDGAGGQRAARQLRIARDHLGAQVVGLVQDGHAADRRADRRRVRRRGDAALLELPVDLAQQAGAAEVLVVGQQREQRRQHGAAQHARRDVERADGRRRAPVRDREAVAALDQREADAVQAEVAGLRAAQVALVAPRRVRQPRQAPAHGARRVLGHAVHRALDARRAVLVQDLPHAPAREVQPGQLRLDLQRDQVRQARPAGPGVEDVVAEHALVDEPDGRHEARLLEAVVGVGDEAARLRSAQLALVDAVVDPGEEPALPEHGREDGRVLLVVGAHPRVVLDEDVPSRMPGFAERCSSVHLMTTSAQPAKKIA